MTASARAGTTTETPGPLPLGTTIASRFTLDALIALEGGTALYRARDAQGGPDVALRLIPPTLVGNRGALEADLARAQRVSHRGLAQVLGFGESQGFVFVAGELVDGHTLRQVIDAATSQGRPVGGKSAHTLLGHVALALEEAYKALPHGALGPASIVVGRSGRVVVTDLGLGRACPALAFRGAPAGAPEGLYVAPEIAKGVPPSAATDVYAVGVMLYELLTGVPPSSPYRSPSQVNPEVPVTVDTLIARALAAATQGRPPTPTALVDELGAALGLAPAASSSAAMPRRTTGSISVPRVTGRTFNAAAAAGLDEAAERWLVQKDRLDYGPYSMASVMSEIERGTFGGNDWIVDTETGERQLISEHPQLSGFTKGAERKLEAARRARAEQNLEQVEKKKGRVTFVVLGGAVAIVAVGVGLWLMNRQSHQEDVLASRVGEADIDAFLKGVKIDFAQKKRAAPRRAGGGSSRGDDFSNDMNLGDVTKGGGDEVLSEGEIQQVMMGNYRKLIPCIMEEKRRSPGTTDFEMDFVVLGSGKVSKVRVNGQQNGALAGCVLGRMQSFSFRKFNGAKSIASWSMSIR